MYVDSKNNVWVGTLSGLDRLNRETETFIHYHPETENPNSLSGTRVNSILEDNEGNLWVGTFDSGLNKFNRETEQFTRYRYRCQEQTDHEQQLDPFHLSGYTKDTSGLAQAAAG